MTKKIAKLGIIAVLTFALILSSLGALPFGDTLAKEFDIGAKNQTTAQAAVAWDGSTKTAPTGEGTENSPYLIGTAEQLAYVADKVNSDATYSNGKFFKLTANIVLNAETPSASTPGANAWIPIGDATNQFNGEFDGADHTVSGIYINGSADNQGLFGNVGSETVNTATVKNVGVINSYIKGKDNIGGVVGWNYGKVINCYNLGAVTGTQNIGGVVGRNDGNAVVINCYNRGAVIGTQNAGGVAGLNYSNGTVSNCYNTGAVKGTSSCAGGVVGYNDNTVANCYNTGAVSGTTTNIGGVVGNNQFDVTNCYFLKTTGINETLNAAGTAADTKTDTCGYFGGTDGALTAEFGEIIGKNKKLFDALNAGVTAYNTTEPAPAILATGWVEVTSSYPKHKVEGGVTPPPVSDPNAWTYPTEVPTKPFAKGDGSVGAPFEISTAQELANMSYLINTANTTYNGKDVHYKLTANIELNDTTNWADWGTTATGIKAWTPIGNATNAFNGTFDGNGKTVSGIYINAPTADYQGLFGKTSATATIKNVGVINSYIKGKDDVGGIVGYNFGKVTNCYNNGAVCGGQLVGGIVGENDIGSVVNCYNIGKVSGGNNVGGVVGFNIQENGEVINCYNTGDLVNSGAGTNFGGIVGNNNGSVVNSYNSGAVKGDNNVGGVVGSNFSSVVNCYNRGEVSGSTVVGGVVGDTFNNIVNCYFLTAKITINNILQNETQEKAVANFRNSSSAINCSPFSAEQKLTTKGETAKDTNGALVAFDANADLLEILNAGKTVYNAAHLAPLTPAADWLKGADGYPNHTAGSVTPPEPEPDPDPAPDPTGWTYPTASTDLSKPFAKGSGTVGAPFEISTPQELANMSYLINTANTTYNGKDVFYKLTKDIVLNTGTISKTSTDATPWTPIGNNSSAFNGSFDGDGYAVSGLYINGEVDNQGLFGKTSATATVMNVGVKNSYIMGKFYPGGVVGWNSGAIFNCYNTGAVSGQYSVGGVVGMSMSTATVTNCYNTGVVTSTGNFSGGVLGSNLGSVTNCYNRKEVSGQNKVGGVVGGNSGSVDNCYNTGEVKGSSYVGGVVGSNESGGTVTNCYFLKITGSTNKDLNAVGKASDTDPEIKTATCGTFVDNAGTLEPEDGTIIDSKNNLLDALNAGATANNTAYPTATQAMAWVKVADDYPTLKVGGVTPPTPPTGGGDSDSEPSISPEDIFWTRVITDLKLKDEPVVEFNCKYPRMSRSVLLALQEVDKTLNINLNGEKISLTSKQVKPLTFDKATYSVAELKALLEVKPEVTPTPTPTPTEKPTEPVVPEKPAANLTWLWILLAVIVVAGAVVAFVVIKRKKK